MGTCPYCEKETSAVKNHVRLTSGSGHGEYGKYPEDFNEGRGTVQSEDGEKDDVVPGNADDGSVEASGGGESDQETNASGGGGVPPDEVDAMIAQAREEGYAEGYEEGVEDALAEEEESDLVELPCGHDSFNEKEAPDPPFEAVCDTCGKSWSVTG